MKISRSLLLVSIVLTYFAFSCKKGQEGPYDPYIRGVVLTYVSANPVSSIGQPDNHTQSDSFLLGVYPNPSMNEVRAFVIIDNKVPVKLQVKIMSAIFEDAPPGIIIENKSDIGKIFLSQGRSLDVMPADTTTGGINGNIKGQTVYFKFDVSALPRGFYRLYVETDQGALYWDNLWLNR